MKEITYIYRPLLNASVLELWAKFYELEMVEDPHVTIAYSKTPIKLGFNDLQKDTLYIPKEERRLFRMGITKALVLDVTQELAKDKLRKRHAEFRKLGATWDFAHYIPHITVSMLTPGQNTKGLPFFNHDLIFGPEILEVCKK